MTVRVLVADDQDLVRTGLTMILDAQPDIEVVGQAADGHAAIDLARRLRPDVCLVDIRMPELDGIEATRRIRALPMAQPAIVALTASTLADERAACFSAGVTSFLAKPLDPDELLATLVAVLPVRLSPSSEPSTGP